MLQTTCIGHLGKDAIVNQINGSTVINFNVAHSEKWTDKQGNKKEKAIWLSCSFWSDRTAIAPYLKKGQLVCVQGKVEAYLYEDQNRQPQVALRLTVSNIELLGGAKKEDPQNNTTAGENSEPVDDLPF